MTDRLGESGPAAVLTPFERMIAEAENAPLLKQLNAASGYRLSVVPHRSAEGGLDTVGFGHKFLSEAEQRSFVSLDGSGAVRLLRRDLEDRGFRAARVAYDTRHGPGHFDVLPDFAKQMAAAIQFNTKSGMSGFPSMSDALERRDWGRALDEMRLDTSKIPGLARRNQMNRDFFGPSVAEAVASDSKKARYAQLLAMDELKMTETQWREMEELEEFLDNLDDDERGRRTVGHEVIPPPDE